jgi:hypothetical protein
VREEKKDGRKSPKQAAEKSKRRKGEKHMSAIKWREKEVKERKEEGRKEEEKSDDERSDQREEIKEKERSTDLSFLFRCPLFPLSFLLQSGAKKMRVYIDEW